jgi:hypothetical protein
LFSFCGFEKERANKEVELPCYPLPEGTRTFELSEFFFVPRILIVVAFIAVKFSFGFQGKIETVDNCRRRVLQDYKHITTYYFPLSTKE